MNTNMYPEEILQARINGGTQTLRIIDGLVEGSRRSVRNLKAAVDLHRQAISRT